MLGIPPKSWCCLNHCRFGQSHARKGGEGGDESSGTQRHVFWPVLTCCTASKPLIFIVVTLSSVKPEIRSAESGYCVFPSLCVSNLGNPLITLCWTGQEPRGAGASWWNALWPRAPWLGPTAFYLGVWRTATLHRSLCSSVLSLSWSQTQASVFPWNCSQLFLNPGSSFLKRNKKGRRSNSSFKT